MYELLIYVILFIIGELLRPKARDARAIPFEDLKLPQNDPNRKIPVIWGTVKLEAPHLMAFPYYGTRAIRKRAGLFDKPTVAHRYYVGMALGLCRGPATLRKIYYDGKLLWSGTAAPADAGVLITIDADGFLGGRLEGGGIAGNLRYYGGTPTQGVNAYLAGFQSPQPAYRGRAYIVFEYVRVGESPNISGFSFEVERFTNPLGLGTDNRIEGEESGVLSEQNVASAIAELFLESDLAGYGLTNTEVDTANMAAVAAVLKDEGDGMSLAWVNGDSVIEIIRQMCLQIDAVPRFNTRSGKWELKLGRQDYVVASLPLIDESNSTLLSYSRGNWTETVNTVIVRFRDRLQDGEPGPAVAYDLSNFDRQGTYQTMTVDYPGVQSRALASTKAARDLRTNGFPLASFDLRINRELWDVLPGDVVRYSNAKLGITNKVIRIGEVGLGDQQNGAMTFKGVEDVFALGQAITAATQASLHSPVAGAPTDIIVRYVRDQPYFLAIRDPAASAPGAVHKPLALAASPQGHSLSYGLWTRQGSEAFVQQQTSIFTGTGTLQSAMAENTSDTVASVVVLGVDTGDIDDDIATAIGKTQIQRDGLNLGLIVSASGEPEYVAFDSATVSGTTVTLTNVRRGLLDTLPAAHLAGDRFWFVSSGAGTSLSEYAAAEAVDVRLTNITNVGELAVGSAANNAVTFRNRVARPYLPGGFKVNTQRYPTSITGPVDLTFAWLRRDRLRNDFRYQDDVDDQLEAGTEYELKIFHTTGLVLKRTQIVTGTSYVHTIANQTADNGGVPFTGSYTVRLIARRISDGTTSLLTIERVFTLA